jgi:uncharacterized protein (DUF58 family)
LLARSGWLVVGGAAIALVAGRMFGLVELYLVAACLVALVALAVGRVVLTRLELEVGRHLNPRRVHAGQQARVELTVANHSIRTTPVLRLHDPVSGTQGATVLLSPLDPEGIVRSAYRLPTDRRGLIGVGPLRVVVADPFGLASLSVEAAPRIELTVLPRVDDILPPPMAGGDEPLAGLRLATLAASAGDDFAALREYVVGDDLRRVHWPSSARHGDLLVRQDEVHWQGRTTIVLDTRGHTHTVDSFEASVSAAASVIAAAWKRRDLVRLVTTAGWDSGIDAGHGHAERLLDELARVSTTQQGTLRGAVGGVSRMGSGALVVVAGTLPDVERAGLAGAAVVGRHLLTLVAVTGGKSTAAGTRAGGDVIAIDAPDGFAAAWNQVMVRRGVARRGGRR